MLTGHTWVAIQYRLDGFSEGENVANGYRWADRQEHAAALRWSEARKTISWQLPITPPKQPKGGLR